MAVSTMHTYLMHGTGEGTITWERLICITDYPDLFSQPEQLDKTTLCDTGRHYEPGLSDNGVLEFNAFYPGITKFTELKALEGAEGNFALWFGGTGDGETSTPTGDEGKFTFTGTPYFSLTGAGVGDTKGILISIYPSSDVSIDAGE